MGNLADKPRQEQSAPETRGFEEPGAPSRPIPINLKGAKPAGGRDKPRVQLSRDGSAAPSSKRSRSPRPAMLLHREAPKRFNGCRRGSARFFRASRAPSRSRSAPSTIGSGDAVPSSKPSSAAGATPAVAKERVEAQATAAALTATATAAADRSRTGQGCRHQPDFTRERPPYE
jgi:hypothetical protein